MSMVQLVLGTAIGFLAAQAGLYGFRQFAGWLPRDAILARLRELSPVPASVLASGFIRYAAPIGAGVALITLGVWAVSDYLGSRSAHSTALAATLESAADAPAPVAIPVPATPLKEEPDPASTTSIDPYKDPEFKVHRRGRVGKGAQSLKDSLLQHAEAKARADLLSETRLHINRSQYDCEAADRADKYLKAGLDVWGFAAWQARHFPAADYQGATLTQCKDITAVVDPARVDERTASAQGGQS